MSKFYEYDQNNSGGFFIEPATAVYVEADSAEEADRIAERHGVYFDGVVDGMDCGCCGDRWWRAEEYRSHEELPGTGDGFLAPKHLQKELIVYKDRVEERRVVRDDS